MSSNGRTADSGSVNGGSTPSIPAICAVCFSLLARSSSGSGRRPLKAEITGSNPVRATMSSRSTRKLLYITARSSSGSGRRPLKAEITGSNPVRATKPEFGEPCSMWFAILLFAQVWSGCDAQSWRVRCMHGRRVCRRRRLRAKPCKGPSAALGRD